MQGAKPGGGGTPFNKNCLEGGTGLKYYFKGQEFFLLAGRARQIRPALEQGRVPVRKFSVHRVRVQKFLDPTGSTGGHPH